MNTSTRPAPALPPPYATAQRAGRWTALGSAWLRGWQAYARERAAAEQIIWSTDASAALDARPAALPWTLPGERRASLERDFACCG